MPASYKAISAGAASTTTPGAVELATDTEAKALSSQTLAVTPGNLAAVFASPPALGSTTPAAVNAAVLKLGTASDVVLERDAANILAQRNGTAAQTNRWYSSYTSGVDNEGVEIITSNVASHTLRTFANGTGTARALLIDVSGTTGGIVFRTNGIGRFQIGSAGSGGHFTAVTDNSLDIGASGANRPRTLYLGTNLIVGGAGVIGAASPAATAILELSSTTKGFLPPRMTTTERDAISTPAAGLLIYNTTTGKLNFRTSSAWEAVTSV